METRLGYDKITQKRFRKTTQASSAMLVRVLTVKNSSPLQPIVDQITENSRQQGIH